MAAAAALTAAQAELISSLSQNDIPIKLRCAVCSRLAVNAFRLPCCDQAICETCQSTIQPTCPVCEHNPVSAGDCKPHKSLRTTIKVFLRTAEKKREALRAKKETPPATPSTPTIAPTTTAAEPNNVPAAGEIAESKDEAAPPPEEAAAETVGSAENIAETATENQVHEPTTNENQQDIPHQSIEEIAPGQERSADAVDADEPKKDGEDGKDAVMAEQMTVGPMGQMPGFGTGFGFDAMGGGFPGMGLNGQPDLNQMQQMQMMMMQNGMGNGFGGFPMMAPGMMDPMTMQNMMMQNMNGGGFGMGANGMNGMNMGMGGMGAGFDGGMNNGFAGWNNQQSWNGGQDNNFNQGNASGMGAADFSANNSGYHHNAAGYNQGNYGRNQHNDFQRGFQRNRGRGGRHHGFQGRSGYGSNMNESFSQQFPQHGQKAVSLTPSGPVLEGHAVPTGPKADTVASAPAANVDEFGREVRAITETKEPEDSTEKADTAMKDDSAAAEGDAAQVVEEPAQNQGENTKSNGQSPEDIPKPILTLEEIERSQQVPANGPYNSMHPQSPMGPPVSRGRRGSFNSHHRGHGGPIWQQNAGLTQPPVAPDVPLNAPTGPKAMREGLPNTSIRGRTFTIAGRNGVRANSIPQITPTEPSGSRTPRNDKDRSRSRSRSKSRSPSRSRSNERRSDRHRSRRHRHRSASLSEETEEERKRRRERRRKYDEKYGSDIKDEEKGSKDDRNGAEEKFSRDGERVEKSRSASPDSKRSSHRSRRDREKERDYKSSSSRHHSSREHRSYRDRSRDRGRSKDRERSRDREHRHRREKEKYHDDRNHDDKYQDEKHVDEKYQEDRDIEEPTSAVENIAEKEASDTVPETPTSQNSGLEIKGSHRRSLREVEEKERNGHDQRSSSHQYRAEDEIKIPSGPRGMREQEEKRASRSARFDSSSNHSHRFSSSSQRDKDHSSDHRERERGRDRDSRSSLSKISAPKGPRALESNAPSHPGVDPHTAEREARNRERLMKEAQRMAGLSSMMGGGGRKRSRDDIGVGESTSSRGRKSRRRGGFGGDGVDEGDEDRIARLESEREAR